MSAEAVHDACVLVAGTLTRDFKHLNVDMFLFEEEGKKFLKVECHFGKRKNIAAIRTASSHVQVRCPLPIKLVVEAVTMAESILKSTVSLDHGCNVVHGRDNPFHFL